MTDTADLVRLLALISDPARLKLLLAICQSPEIGSPGWSGTFNATISPDARVKFEYHKAVTEVHFERSAA